MNGGGDWQPFFPSGIEEEEEEEEATSEAGRDGLIARKKRKRLECAKSNEETSGKRRCKSVHSAIVLMH
jgi:hypothetical protein